MAGGCLDDSPSFSNNKEIAILDVCGRLFSAHFLISAAITAKTDFLPHGRRRGTAWRRRNVSLRLHPSMLMERCAGARSFLISKVKKWWIG